MQPIQQKLTGCFLWLGADDPMFDVVLICGDCRIWRLGSDLQRVMMVASISWECQLRAHRWMQRDGAANEMHYEH